MSNKERGYSLVELMVAMTVTLIISGAVMQLIAAGNTAFRRDPQLADRQQNIRVGMDILSRDAYRVGYGVPQFAQVFTDNLDGVGPMGSGGAPTDEIEMFMASECPPLEVCPIAGEAGKSITTRELFTACYSMPALVLLADETTWALRWAEKPGGGAAAGGKCDDMPPGTKGGHAVFPPGQAPLVNPTGGFAGWDPEYMMVGQAVRYRVNLDAEGVPNLERSAFGGQPDPDGNSTWQIVARGVEDLQVEYENGAGWQDEPGPISCGLNCANPTPAELDTLVRRVRIRLSARVTGGGQLAGESASVLGNAVRGQLVTEIMPRPVSATLGMYRGEL